MSSIDKLLRSEVRKMARKGRLVDEAFKVFQRMVYPDAPPDQVAAMRTCFFAGAAELYAIQMAGMDDGVPETDGDVEFFGQVVDEITRFHERTISAATAKGPSN